MKPLRTRLDEAIKSFVKDPPASVYQQGYYDALVELSICPTVTKTQHENLARAELASIESLIDLTGWEVGQTEANDYEP